MELLGLSLAQFLGLLFATSSMTVALYLLRLRRKDVIVPYLHFFKMILSERKTTAWLSKKTRLISLLFALLIISLLTLAFADPRKKSRRTQARTLVLLIDTSASMQATDVKPNRLEAAKNKARTLVRTLGPDDQMMIVSVDANSIVRTPLTSDVSALNDAIHRIQATDTQENLGLALSLATNALRSRPHPEIIWLTDGAKPQYPPEWPTHIPIHAERIGMHHENLGISAFAVRRYPLDRSQAEILIEIDNPTEEQRRVELELLGDGRSIDIKNIDIPAQGHEQRFLSSISGVNQRLEAIIRPIDGKPDLLAADNHAYARIAERKRTSVLVVSENNLYLDAALLLDEYLQVTHVNKDDYSNNLPSDVVIFDACTPQEPPNRPAIYIYPIQTSQWAPFQITGVVESPSFENLNRRHPLLRFTALADVNIAKSLQLKVQREDHVIGGDRRTPLLISGTRNNYPFFAIAFDVRESDLPLRVAWPLLLLHAIDHFVDDQANYTSSIQTGITARVPFHTSENRALLSSLAMRTTVPVVEQHAVVQINQAGFYLLESAQTQNLIAVNLSSKQETNIAPQSLEIRNRPISRPQYQLQTIDNPPWIWLAWSAAILLLIEWWTFHRRWTV